MELLQRQNNNTLRFLILVLINLLVFWVSRWLALLLAFGVGFTSGGMEKYFEVVLIVTLLIQFIGFLLLYRKTSHFSKLNYILIVGLLIALHVAGRLDIIPIQIVPR